MDIGYLIGLVSLIIAAIYLGYSTIVSSMNHRFGSDFVWTVGTLVFVLIGVITTLLRYRMMIV